MENEKLQREVDKHVFNDGEEKIQKQVNAKIIRIMEVKEMMLNNIISWLKNKELYEQCIKDLKLDKLWAPAQEAVLEIEELLEKKDEAMG